MLNEPEPRSPHSADEHLNAFRKELDWEQPTVTKKILPGFLFRHGKDVEVQLDKLRRTDNWDWRWGDTEEELLKHHLKTHSAGLEARSLVRDRIKPIEVLGMVRDIWGKGEIEQTEEGGTLTYSYLKTEPKVVVVKLEGTGRRISSFPDSGVSRTTYTQVKSGKWTAYSLEVKEVVAVRFGNAKFPPHKLWGHEAAEVNEFFADQIDPDNFDGVPRGVPSKSTIEYGLPIRLPERIWTRPDNLGISVTVPYALQNTSPGIDGIGKYKPIGYFEPFAWFDQSASQQEIMDYLSQQLETQKFIGQLPSQVEILELAKIEELKKRQLFVEGPPKTGKIWGSGVQILYSS